VKTKTLFKFLVAAFALATTFSAEAAICQFNTTAGPWDNPSNWNNCAGGNGAVPNTPGPADRAEITGGTVTLAAATTYNVGDLYLGAAIIQGGGMASSVLNVVNGGTIAWGSGSYTFQNMTATFNASSLIPAANGPLTVDNAEVAVLAGTTAAFADITVNGTGAKFRNNGVVQTGNLTMTAGGKFQNDLLGVHSVSAPTTTVNGLYDNLGKIEILGGSVVQIFSASVFNQGNPSASIGGNGQISSVGQVLNITAGFIEGNLTFNLGTLNNTGAILSPGGPGTIGNITINGNYAGASTADLDIDITFNSTVIVKDMVTISGAATLGPSNVNFYYIDTGFGPYTTTQGDVINFMTFASLSGGFGGFGAPASGNSTSLNYTATAAQFVVGAPLAPDISVNPTSLMYPSQAVSSTSTPQILTITNTGTGTLNIFNIFSSLPDFQTTFVPPDALPGRKLSMQSLAQPIESLATGQSQITGLTGKVPGMAVTLTRVGSPPAQVITRPANPNCSFVLPAGALCDVNITFAPIATGTRSGQITINSSAPSSPTIVPITGIAVAAATSDIGVTGSTTFPLTAVGSASGTQTITITNTGAATLVISSISHTNPDIFGDTVNGPPPQAAHWCGFGSDSMGFPVPGGPINIAPAATCQLVLVFRPNTAGTLNGTITINSNAPSSPTAIVLTGTAAVAPTATLTPDPLNFGNVNVGSTSAPLTATFTNPSGTPLTIGSIGVGPQFNIVGGTCMVSLVVAASGGSCTIDVTATPTGGLAGSALQVSTSPLSNNPSVIVQVNGIAPPPNVTLAVGSGTILIGTSTPFTITLHNTGTASNPISSGSMSLPGGLSVAATPMPSTTCGSSVTASGTSIGFSGGSIPPSSNCTITVPVQGDMAGAYTLNFPAGALSTGTGINASAATIGLTVASAAVPAMTVAFAPTTMAVGGTSIMTLTLTNPGASGAGISGGSVTLPAGLTGAPPGTNSCGTFGSFSGQTYSFGMGSVPAMGSCTIDISVTSAAVATYTVTIPAGALATAAGSNANTSSASLTVTAASSPAITLNASSVNFGTRTINTTSPVTTVTLTNTGMANLLISAISGTGGDFAYSTTCPISTPPVFVGGTCNFNITFTPLTSAALTGSITITSNAAGSPHVISLSGTGVPVPVPNLTLGSSSLAFGNVQLATVSAENGVLVTNTGFATLSLTNITITGAGFARVVPSSGTPPDCGTSLAPGANCQVAIRFTPAALGAATGQISFTSNAAGSPHLVSLTATGVSFAQAGINVATSLEFASQIINTTSAGRVLAIDNTGNAALSVSSVSLGGTNAADFIVTGDCSSVPASGNCTLIVTFTPRAIGVRSAVLTIVSDAGGTTTTNTVQLTGSGILAPLPIASLSVTSIGYGNNIFGGATPNQVVTLRNTGGVALSITSIFTIGDFFQSNGCPLSLAAGASCVVNVQFSPLGVGNRSGELQVLSNAAGSPHKVLLSGTGCRWFSQAQSRFFLTSCGN
jgi:hypothetical protein